MLTKEEITFLYENGFSISEIKNLENPLKSLTESEKASDTAGVDEKPKEEVIEKKTEEVGSSDTIEELKKQVADLTKMVQKKNREDVTNDTPKRVSTEEIMKSYFENL